MPLDGGVLIMASAKAGAGWRWPVLVDKARRGGGCS